MSYNLKGLQLDENAAVAVVRLAQVDVLGVQEPPRGPLRKARLRRWAERAGLRVVVDDFAARTTALLARPDAVVEAPRAHRLPWRVGWTRRGFATARVDGVEVVVLHLSVHPEERARHLDLVEAYLAQVQGPLVVVGDLNEGPDGPAWQRLARYAQDTAGGRAAPTFRASGPRHRIDAVLASPELEARKSRVLRDAAARRASDHLPLVVDVAGVDAAGEDVGAGSSRV
ncbi:endonuclease/exonuclease/phosphatase family protein [Cellulomonas chengniuliangii]|uniref:Endonuclease/exonuclease/phosphatase family protein n=1 Tax=Cellulomonas chengniuliangii TaxID=2968084 RepID=A0ABY5KWT5_9CELL|nr:endonuclease/exonuclease/phosphatase family protein [Cellulomonas chengniuliangii]MCC2309496.1 endonuclease/exonuclease/phosphatase family protein [Cellulomonas chengniuliangii]MCC2316767.1 endonuclease/exonuclease/phosphatase family protein [Cellulomonas chengniuliangii]UUI74945.1 endonuclease/exonuclease/phosphatase family protein [Cellulomonas chengniuliangii]